MDFEVHDGDSFPGKARTDWDAVYEALKEGKAVAIPLGSDDQLETVRQRIRKRMLEKGIHVTTATRDGKMWVKMRK